MSKGKNEELGKDFGLKEVINIGNTLMLIMMREKNLIKTLEKFNPKKVITQLCYN